MIRALLGVVVLAATVIGGFVIGVLGIVEDTAPDL